jgi:hypothetical protein
MGNLSFFQTNLLESIMKPGDVVFVAIAVEFGAPEAIPTCTKTPFDLRWNIS